MNRTRLTGAFAIGAALVLLANPAQATAPKDATAAQRPVGSGTTVPLTADKQVRYTTVDGAKGTAASRFYRDSQGRTRVEAGPLVTIEDPATRTVVNLDTKNRTYERTSAQRSAAPAAPQEPGVTIGKDRLSSARRSLGTATMSGVLVEGSAYTVTTPAYKSKPAERQEVTAWVSKEIRLPVQTRVVDADGKAYVETYTNISAGVEPSADLFAVPAGYRPASGVGSPSAAMAPCAFLYVDPFPLILFSDGPFWGRGWIGAATDASVNCYIVASALVSEWNSGGWPYIWGGPVTPIPTPLHIWEVWDAGAMPPFFPYLALGDVAWLAYNGSDETVVDSLILLYILS
jgi:hypothetical protein